MTDDGLQYQIERSDDTATLYLSGVVPHTDDIAALAEICNALPASVRTLRLDLTAVRRIGSDAMEAVGVLLCEWRESRAGDFRMFFGSPYTSSCGVSGHLPRRTHPVSPGRARPVNEALTGTYL